MLAKEKSTTVRSPLSAYHRPPRPLAPSFIHSFIHHRCHCVLLGPQSDEAVAAEVLRMRQAVARRELEALYTEHNPEKLLRRPDSGQGSELDELLHAFNGRESELVEAVRQKYEGPGRYRAELVALYERYNPEKIADVDALLLKYAGAEKDLIQAVKDKYEGFDVDL